MEDDYNKTHDMEELVDIRDIKIDRSLPIEERVRSYVEQVKNPYCFRVGDVKVRVSYSDKEETLDQRFGSMISTM